MALQDSSGFGLLYQPSQISKFGLHPRQDNWTGTSNPAQRRKIQNRLNQRASRNRRTKALSSQSPASSDSRIKLVDGVIDMPNGLTFEVVDIAGSSSSRIPKASLQVQRKEPGSYCGRELEPTVYSRPSSACVSSSYRNSITSANDFTSWIKSKLKKQGHHAVYPFSADHLLTLLHFNVVRALTSNIIAIGIDPNLMSLDIPSPFFLSQTPFVPKNPDLPWTLRPTELQQRVSHHPFIDVFPSRRIRDNLLQAGVHFDEEQLCNDILGSTVAPDSSTEAISQTQTHGSTGLLIWGEPWHPANWEFTEIFLRRWQWLFMGCGDLLESTNYWRQMRGEEPLVLELD